MVIQPNGGSFAATKWSACSSTSSYGKGYINDGNGTIVMGREAQRHSVTHIHPWPHVLYPPLEMLMDMEEYVLLTIQTEAWYPTILWQQCRYYLRPIPSTNTSLVPQ